MIVLLASNKIVPFTEGSFRLILKKGETSKTIQNFSNQSDFHFLTQRETSTHRHTCIPFYPLSGPRSPIARSIFSAVNTQAVFTFS